MKKLLIVEDNRMELEVLKADLERSGYQCLTAADGVSALDVLADSNVDIVLSDQNMPRMDGLELLRKIKQNYANIPFIMMTSAGSVDSAVASIKQGANDYILKPYNLEELQATIKRSIGYQQISVENKELKNELYEKYRFENIIAKSASMLNVLEKAKLLSKSPSTTVAIYGESGTGKELLARAIHLIGKRSKHRFVAVNCAGIPSTLLESELFGYVKGAFTGADNDKQGKFDIAQGGTLLLDEIGDMPLNLQAKLLRSLEQRNYERIGSNETIKIDFTFIIATHRNIEEMVKEGTFRKDLFHRINVFPITVPPLRDRKEDIPLVVNHFLNQFNKEMGKTYSGISKSALDSLMEYSWPGNIRELKNCLERAAILVNNEMIQPFHLSISTDRSLKVPPPIKVPENRPTDSTGVHFNFSLTEEEMSLDNIIGKTKSIVLKHCGNNKSKAGKLLKRDRNIFYRKNYSGP